MRGLTLKSSIYKLKSDNEVTGLNKGAPAFTWCSYSTINVDVNIEMHVVELTVSLYIAKIISMQLYLILNVNVLPICFTPTTVQREAFSRI